MSIKKSVETIKGLRNLRILECPHEPYVCFVPVELYITPGCKVPCANLTVRILSELDPSFFDRKMLTDALCDELKRWNYHFDGASIVRYFWFEWVVKLLKMYLDADLNIFNQDPNVPLIERRHWIYMSILRPTITESIGKQLPIKNYSFICQI